MNRNSLITRAGAALLTSALVISGTPAIALADTPPAPPSGSAPAGNPPSGGFGGGANTQTFDYSGTYSAALTANGTAVSAGAETYAATEADQNAALAQNGGTLTLNGTTLTKSGDDTDGDRCNFYGVNSILLAVGEGSSVDAHNVTLSATSAGSNGVFATDNANVTISDSSITTTANNSRGLDATYGGSIAATNVTISTQGAHCAALATDRGGGTVTLDNSQIDGVIETAGSGSPLLYSTGDIEVTGVTGTATGSQIAGMEGLNTIVIKDSTLTSTVTGKTASDPIADAVIIYQSTSGDAETSTGSTAKFVAEDSTLTSSIRSGAFFYLTNTTANIELSNTTLSYDSSKAALIAVQGNNDNNWGTAGSNGADASFVLRDMTVAGDATVDDISTLEIWLLEGTTWTGAASVSSNANASATVDAPLAVNVDATSTWVVTESCEVSTLNVAAGGKVVDASGATVTIQAADGTVLVQGSSNVTVTVTSGYEAAIDEDEVGAETNETRGSGSGQGGNGGSQGQGGTPPEKPGEGGSGQGGQGGPGEGGETPPDKPGEGGQGQEGQDAEAGWTKKDGTWYYVQADGSNRTGWFQDSDGTWYYLDAATDGAMATGWKKVDGSWFLFNAAGAMLTGWQQDGGAWYYLGNSGAMKSNAWVSWGGAWYYLGWDGAMLVNTTTPDGYAVDANGAWIQ